MDRGDGGHTPALEAESQGCLLIVAAFTEVARALEPVAADAAARIMISPVLGDFIELRFLDMGPRPQDDAGFTPVAARIADEFTHPGTGAAENYFALVVADDSAAVTEQTIGACRANPIVAALPLRYRGLAAIDDRLPAPGKHEADAGERRRGASDRRPGLADPIAPDPGVPDPSTALVIPASRGWARRDLINELRTYAGILMHDFATGHEPGLTLAELGSIRSRDEEILLGGQVGPAPDAEGDAASGAAPPAIPPAAPGPPPGPEEPTPSRAGVAPSRAAVPGQTAPSSTSVPQRGPRWSLRWRRGRGGEPAAGPGRSTEATAGDPVLTVVPQVRLTAAVFMVLTGADGPDGRTGWNRGRALLVEVDQELAAASQARFMTRTLLSAEDADKGTLRQAGELSRRDMKRPVSYADFAQLLTELRTVVKRDSDVLVRSGADMAPPGVVFFAVEPPLADAITAEAYQELAREASVMWVQPAGAARPLSPVFTTAAARIIPDHPMAASEVVDMLRRNAGITPAQGSAESATG